LSLSRKNFLQASLAPVNPEHAATKMLSHPGKQREQRRYFHLSEGQVIAFSKLKEFIPVGLIYGVLQKKAARI
jgi:hypothetical protein